MDSIENIPVRKSAFGTSFSFLFCNSCNFSSPPGMFPKIQHSLITFVLITLCELVVIVRVLLRPHRDPLPELLG